jgi:hypothetical protein
MPSNCFIAIGGTGSRCLEAIVYLASAGMLKDSLSILIIDPDQNAGNSIDACQIVSSYGLPHQAQQHGPKTRLFQPEINRTSTGGNEQHTQFWANPNSVRRRFREMVECQAQRDDFENSPDILYKHTCREMTLDFCHLKQINISTVAIKGDLERTADVLNRGLREFFHSLNEDLYFEEARIFMTGAVFGGTGAGSPPKILASINGLPNELISKDNHQKRRHGCAMMTSCFSISKGKDLNTRPNTAAKQSKWLIVTRADMSEKCELIKAMWQRIEMRLSRKWRNFVDRTSSRLERIVEKFQPDLAHLQSSTLRPLSGSRVLKSKQIPETHYSKEDLCLYKRQRFRTANGALSAAQIKVAGGVSYQHPYYWAPFIAVGSSN